VVLLADVAVVSRTGASWLLTAPPGAGEIWLRARVVDADQDVVLLEAGDGSRLPGPGSRLVGAHAGGDGVRRFNVVVKRHVRGTIDRFVVSRPKGFERIERRDDARVPVRLPAELVVGMQDGEVETIPATTVDLSSGGVAVVSPHALRAGRRLLVVLHLDDDGGPVLAGGIVAGHQGTDRGGARLGLELQVVDPRDRKRLTAHLASFSRR
jgi:c-di-GMP-binding flagellar brake protein YcgR